MITIETCPTCGIEWSRRMHHSCPECDRAAEQERADQEERERSAAETLKKKEAKIERRLLHKCIRCKEIINLNVDISKQMIICPHCKIYVANPYYGLKGGLLDKMTEENQNAQAETEAPATTGRKRKYDETVDAKVVELAREGKKPKEITKVDGMPGVPKIKRILKAAGVEWKTAAPAEEASTEVAAPKKKSAAKKVVKKKK
jgi:hypothetical protein